MGRVECFALVIWAITTAISEATPMEIEIVEAGGETGDMGGESDDMGGDPTTSDSQIILFGNYMNKLLSTSHCFRSKWASSKESHIVFGELYFVSWAFSDSYSFVNLLDAFKSWLNNIGDYPIHKTFIRAASEGQYGDAARLLETRLIDLLGLVPKYKLVLPLEFPQPSDAASIVKAAIKFEDAILSHEEEFDVLVQQANILAKKLWKFLRNAGIAIYCPYPSGVDSKKSYLP